MQYLHTVLRHGVLVQIFGIFSEFLIDVRKTPVDHTMNDASRVNLLFKLDWEKLCSFICFNPSPFLHYLQDGNLILREIQSEREIER